MDNGLQKKIAIFINEKTEPHPEYQPIEIHQLQFIEGGSIDQLFCNCLNYFTNPKDILVEIAKRVKYNGEIIIEGDEIYDIVRNISIGEIDINNVNDYLYNGRQSVISSIQVTDILRKNRFFILEQEIDNLRFMVKATRNG